MSHTQAPLQERVRAKIDDKVLYENLRNFGTSYRVSRAKALEGRDFPALRRELNQRRSLDPELVMQRFERFKAQAEAAGGTVYCARDAEDANRYILEVCQRQSSPIIVKSKSMTSEETRLNDFLEARGITPVESDLGEWLLQLANEHPSHMVMPAIHKTRQQCARLLEKVAGHELDDNDIDTMVKVARKALRERYFAAGVGFTGANVAVAETGTIATVTNEGNARLSATTPGVHVALMGYEKLVDTFEDALKTVDLLPKCATGQNITTYVTWMKGRNPSQAHPEGLKEMHYVFIDNGRLGFLDHPDFSEALKCIRCGSCANVCPAYEMVGGHVFGHIYIGAIGLIKTALFHGDKTAHDIIGLCVGCKSCSEACPAGIDLQHTIFNLKGYLNKKYGVPGLKRFAMRQVVASPERMRNILKIGAFAQAPFKSKDGRYLRSIPVLPASKDFRRFPSVSSETFLDRFRQMSPLQKSDERVFFYPGCAVEYFYPRMGEALVRILRHAGIEVEVPEKSACCGVPAIAAGDMQAAEQTIVTNLGLMKNPEDYAAYLVLCPTCGMGIKEDVPQYTRERPDEYRRARRIASKVQSLGQYLESRGMRFRVRGDRKVTYHTPCHQGRGMQQTAAPYLQALLGDQFVALTHSDVCCGFGGSYSLDQAEISRGILDKKLGHIRESKADILVTDCPGCVMQIDGGARFQKMDVQVMHLSELLDEHLELVIEA